MSAVASSPTIQERDSRSEFDSFAADYESALQKGLGVSGETADYFACGRMAWMRRRLRESGFDFQLRAGLDFGCGTGNSIGYLLSEFNLATVVGLDTSMQSLQVARSRYPSDRVFLNSPSRFETKGNIDLVHCNGVFHHIPPEERAAALDLIHRSLRAGGLLAYWENNPWNPGTRYVMRRIPFDRDAIPLSMTESLGRIRSAGFDILAVDSRFYFPKALRWLRPIEPWLCKIPLGAQYLVLARKPVLSP